MDILPQHRAAEHVDSLAEARAEMRQMAALLAQTRAEVIGLAPPPGAPPRLGEANDTLDMVVIETERAAFEIMRQAERMQAAAVRLDDTAGPEYAADAAAVNEAATAIVMACIFQDITGQRIRKVIGALREVEARVARLIELLGIAPDEVQSVQQGVEAVGDPLLNGPSSPEQGGLGQGAVDDLFA
ncbi:protein phosphatase CheZ [Paracraurococcus lichenis]|uniref:Protein phosphatase CheZ n=1 Tax=Paracraurococcus lichenis TaxID=3064888 RepID=A0ABT9EAY5_9PROT|nr:protein phosphatase CheZ [Paracraurococcus sp. LOR1-02]MDO9713372.1 protein phosphatase CheZ [Paracraurococcus sp. LOR1-02]